MRFFTSVTSAIAISSAAAFVPSTPSSGPRSFALRMSATTTGVAGTVKWYNAERGFGFIAVDDGGPDMYVHATGLSFQGPLVDGERVSFETETDRRTNKPKAVNVERTDDEAPAPVEEEPAAESVVEKAIEVVREELSDDQRREKAVATEKFQRARLQSQLEQRAAELVAEAAAAKKAEAAAAEAKAAAEAAAAKEAEEKAEAEAAAAKAEAEEAAAAAKAKAEAEEAAAAAKAKAEAEEAAAAAKAKAEAEEAAAAAKAKAEAEEAAAAAKAKAEAEEAAAAAEEAAAKELGYPSAAIMKARAQPKSPEEEAALASKYGAMELGERAFAIVTDLGMVELNLDPDDPSRDTSKDDEDME